MPVKAHRTGPGTFKVGETGTSTEFGAQVTNIKATPSLNEEDAIPVLSGEELDGDDTVSWEISVTVLQSFDLEGLPYWSLENALKVLPFEFVPSTEDSEFGLRGQLKVIPIEIGGDVKKRNTSDVTFKVIGDIEHYTIGAGV